MPSVPPVSEPASPVLPPWPVVLRALRQASGITRAGWAARLGYSPSTVQRWERGDSAPDAVAEAALLTLLRQEGLLRRYTAGPLRGQTLTEADLRELLAAARGGKQALLSPPVLQLVGDPRAAVMPTTLPVPLSGVIGREQELADLTALLAQTRLLTITGPGGAGKTRLAVEVAQSRRAAFADGVCFVDLAPLTDPTLVSTAIAQALRVQEQPGLPLLERIVAALGTKQVLLVLDNFEHLLAAASDVGRLVQMAPALTLLVTSRAPLRLRGEQEYPLAPLPLPERAATPAALAANPAVQLFVARARAVRPDFTLTEANGAAVSAICSRLDGLPLAIELAAARIRALPPATLLGRLEQRLPVLTGGARDVPARQQSLRAAIAWSYDLLSADEQRLFRGLSVFAGGCTLAAAEAVCNAAGDIDVLDGLSSLVEHSLLRQGTGADGEPRYTMLETIREFACEQLAASGEAGTVQAGHARWCLSLAQAANPAPYPTAVSPAWQARLAVEHDNLRTALAWGLTAAADDGGEQVLQLAGLLSAFWHVTGQLSEGRRWLGLALGAGAQASAASRAVALAGEAVLAGFQDDRGGAHEQFAAALALWREVDEPRGVAFALSHWGLTHPERDRRRAILEESIALWRRTGDAWGLTMALHMLANVVAVGGDLASAVAAAEEAFAVARAQQDPLWLAQTTRRLGQLAVAQHDVRRGEALLREALAWMRQQGDLTHLLWTLVDLLPLALVAHDLERVRAYGEEALQLADALGDHRYSAAIYAFLGLTEQLDRQEERAAERFAQCLQAAQAQGTRGLHVQRPSVSVALAGLGWYALARGRPEQATRLMAVARALPTLHIAWADQLARPDYERTRSGARAALGEAAFAAAWADGQALSDAQALAEALALTEEFAPRGAEP